jgi:hypothetical protein
MENWKGTLRNVAHGKKKNMISVCMEFMHVLLQCPACIAKIILLILQQRFALGTLAKTLIMIFFGRAAVTDTEIKYHVCLCWEDCNILESSNQDHADRNV